MFKSATEWIAHQEISIRQSLSSSTPSAPTQTSPADESESVSTIISGMSYRQRVAGFVTTFSIGVFCDLLAVTLFVPFPVKFAKLYTLGNVCLLLSTLFLVGWQRQLRNMADPTRFFASLVFVFGMFATLYVALEWRRAGPTLLCTIVQTCAAVWYGASYVPFMQRCLRSTWMRIWTS
jgi:hypothetical protein